MLSQLHVSHSSSNPLPLSLPTQWQPSSALVPHLTYWPVMAPCVSHSSSNPLHDLCQQNDNQVFLLSPTLPIDLLWLQQNDNQVFLLSYNTVMSQVPVYLFTCYSCQHEFCYRHTEFFVLFCLLTCYGSQLNNTSFDIVPQHMLLVPFYWPVKAADGTTKVLLWFHFPNSRHFLYWWILQSNIPSPKWGKTNSTVEMTHHPNLTFIIQLYNHSQIS